MVGAATSIRLAALFRLREAPTAWASSFKGVALALGPRNSFLSDLCHNRKILCDRHPPEVDGDAEVIGPGACASSAAAP